VTAQPQQFASDNYAGACPEAMQAMLAANAGSAVAYGDDDWTQAAADRLRALFAKDAEVFFVFNGTAANSLALASLCQSYHSVICSSAAHVETDECGAPEFFSNGSKLLLAPSADGKLTPDAIRALATSRSDIHFPKPRVVTITQPTETGQVYTIAEVQAISAVCRELGLKLHMDGARFAHACAALGCSPAAITWEAGVDVLCFGGTKNGCWCAEALVLFDLSKAHEMHFLRKRSAQLFSKSRFVSAQFEAYFTGDLWLNLARHANAMAAHLAEGIAASKTSRLAWQADANEVFPILRKDVAANLRQQGAVFYDWPVPHDLDGSLAENEGLYRLVTSFATQAEDVQRFVAAC